MTNVSARAAALVLLALVAVVFGQSVLGAFVWDDEVLIAANGRLRGEGAWQHALTDDFWATSVPADVRPGLWRPVVKLSHVALLSLQQGAWPFHLLNVLLHLACVWLAHRWLCARLLGDGRAPEEVARPALLAAALFAVHPTRFEAVGWVSCSTDLFMTLFALAALWAFEARRFVLGAVCVALAMLSKESILLLPAVLALDGWLRGRQERKTLFAAGLGVAVPIALRLALGLRAPPILLTSAGSTVVRAVGALGAYAQRTLWPVPPTVAPVELAPGADPGSLGVALLGLGIVVGLCLLAVTVLAVRRPSLRPVLADLVWWAVLLIPFLELAPRGTSIFVSDRFLYLPLLGACALLARGLAASPKRAPELAAWGAVVAAAMITSAALPAYASALDFFGRELALHPRSTTLAWSYAGQLQRAEHHHARRVVLEQLALRRDDLRTASWATAQLANTVLALTLDGDRPTLEAIDRFYEGLHDGRPVALELGEQRFEVPDADQLVRQARLGLLDDLELHRATVSLELGRLDEALARAEPLAGAPTPRRLKLLARVYAARGDFARAASIIARGPRSVRDSELGVALERASRLPPVSGRCDPPVGCDEGALRLREAWLSVFHDAGLRALEDESLEALGSAPRAPVLRIRALVRRGHLDEALGLANGPGVDPAFAAAVRDEVVQRRAAVDRERALVSMLE